MDVQKVVHSVDEAKISQQLDSKLDSKNSLEISPDFYIRKQNKKFRFHKKSELFWSECRDSNSRPLEPHSSAIPNFATPGYFLAAPQRLSILAHLVEKCKHYFHFFEKNFSGGMATPGIDYSPRSP